MSMNETEVGLTIGALLRMLPANYPQAVFSSAADGYRLDIDHTIIFQGATGEAAIAHTANYVKARQESPDLPVGVIYGMYD